jgi:hypothetical protein
MPIVEVSKILHAPLDKAFQWCTDYSDRDALIAKHIRSRRVVKREANVVYLEDEQLDPTIPMRRTKVTLFPPDKWVAEFEGSTWQGTGTYTLTRHDEDTKLAIVFEMKSIQGDFTPQRLRARVNDIWEKYGAALKSEVWVR